ncbi:glucans biosynthesis protein [Roseibium sp. RKSG952]|nr:glucan biosynthesis protein G [Roseibium sp. RKSG952]MTH95259.1 glucans biosynthesis protein [Roseibium sp. RKSG952]
MATLGTATAAEPQTPAAEPSVPAPQAEKPFDFEAFASGIKEKAAKAYKPDTPALPEILAELDYDKHRAIRYRPERAIWGDLPSNYELHAFHPGWLYNEPVELYEITDTEVLPLNFTGADFEYREPLDPARFEGVKLPGIAGFRLHYPLNTPDYYDELITFLGASYFRALGKGNLYGLSARGLAIDTAISGAEEFPKFTRFYLQKPQDRDADLTLYAELESKSATGAYRFVIKPGVNTVIDVDARIFLRSDVTRLGIAPLTSMFLYGENDRVGYDDYRPEVHDNDGLLVLRKDGQRLWRPLRNPDRLSLSFLDEESPRGFGLSQRDRNFDNYQDTEARYERRPSLWIEPVNDWGKGQVMLAEIPADKEIYDNIVAFWVPENGMDAGSEHRFEYRMLWGREPEPGTDLGRVIRTSTGHGGAGASDPHPNLRKFVIEFGGDRMAEMGADRELQARLSVQNGKPTDQLLQRLEGGVWRLIVDIQRENERRPVELILSLTENGQDVTETWMYQWSGRS